MECYIGNRTAKSAIGFNVLILILLTVMVLPVNLSARIGNVRFDTISVEQGLSNATVNCIFQDSQGFMWFGTDDGLNKFDGYNFTIYRHDNSNLNCLSDNRVLSIFEDSNGLLWVGTDGGLNLFDRKSATFTRYHFRKDFPRDLRYNEIDAIIEDAWGNLWIGTSRKGLFKFDPKKEKFTLYVHRADNTQSLSHNYVNSIFLDSGNDLWIGTDIGLNKFDRKAETFTRFLHQTDNSNSLSHNNITSIFEDSRRNLWIGTNGGGLNKFDRKTETFTRYLHQEDNPYSLSHNNVTSIVEVPMGNLWIGTDGGGLNKFDRNSEDFIRFQCRSDAPFSLSDNKVSSIFVDSGGVLWIGTKHNGLNKIDRNQEELTHYIPLGNKIDNSSINITYSILEDYSGNFWIGTRKGLFKFDRKKEIFTRYQNQQVNPHSLSHNKISSIFEDSKGTLWIGTHEGGLVKLNRKEGTSTRFQHQADNPHSISHNSVSSILEDSGGIIWIGTNGGGLNKFDPESEKFTRFQHQKENPHSLSHNKISSVFEDSQGVLWIGTCCGGLNKFDKKEEMFTRYQFPSNYQNRSSRKTILVIFEDSRGNLWVGTSARGLYKFDRKEGRFKFIKEKNGLTIRLLQGILEDNDGNLWLNTDPGIMMFNPETKILKWYEKGGSLFPIKHPGASYRSKNGRMHFGGGRGFVEFFPDRVRNNRYSPRVVITNFLLFNKSISVANRTSGSGKVNRNTWFEIPQHISFSREITLDYRHNTFTLEFSVLHYSQPENNRFLYKLEGYDKVWQSCDHHNRRAMYKILPHGEYTFRVRASNDRCLWEEQETTLKITILPPWWKTWWAYTLYTLVILGVITWYVWSQKRTQRNLELKVKERTQQLTEANKQLKELDQIKTDYLSFASHELRTPLTSVLGFARIIKKRLVQRVFPKVQIDDDKTSKAVEQVSSNIDIILSEGLRLTELINNVLDIAKMEAGKMEWKKETVSITSVLESAVEATAGLFENKPLEMTLGIQGSLPNIQGGPDRLIQVFINLISNAVKFTEKGAVTCRAEYIGKDICISVTDTGTGIAQEDLPKLFEKYKQVGDTLKNNHKGTGLGLPICKQIVEYHGGIITIESQLNKGTTVTVKLPVGE